MSNKKPKDMQPVPNAFARANRVSDYVVYGISCLILLLPVVIYMVVEGSLIVNTLLAIGAIAGLSIAIRVMHIQFMSNAMRIQNSSLSHLKKDIETISLDLGLPPIDVYVTQNPALNAFAFGVARPYAIVLHSATIEQLTYEEMRAILVHEIGHIKLWHTRLLVYIAPLQLIPFAGFFVTYIFGWWSRRAEYSCDRLAVAYTGDPDVVISALMKVYIGPKIANEITKEHLMYQDNISQNLWRRGAQTLSSHPFLVNRVKAILRFADENGYDMADDLRTYIRTHWNN